MNLIQWEKYLEITDFGKRIIRIATSFGCPYRCAFCCEPANSKRLWKAYTASRVIKYIKNLRKKVDFDGIMIVDNNFFVNEQRVIDICKGLIKNKIKVKFGQVNGRTNDLVRFKPQTWQLMKKAGLYNILIGAESGSEDTLLFINKDATVADTIKLAKICNQYKIFLIVSVIVALPTKKYLLDNQSAFHEDLNGIINLYNKICTTGSNHHLLTFPYAPLPFSPLYNQAIALGFKPPIGIDNWSNYEFTKVYVPWLPKTAYRQIDVLNYISFTVGVDFKHLLNAFPFFPRLVAKPTIWIFKSIGKWRFKTKFLNFPIDMWIYQIGLNLFLIINRKFRVVNIGR